MKPLQTRLQEARKRSTVPWDVLERDYLLSWVLAGIAQVESLRDTLVFKGGTALKKCYFGDYRFSEDLDFSAQEDVPTGEAMDSAIGEVCAAASMLLDEYAPVEITCDRYTEKEPHPGGQEAFVFRARLPWQNQPLTRVLIEITLDEKIVKPAVMRKIIHEYGEPLDAAVLVYSLEEIVAEKLRAILQQTRALEERGWSRSRARDYYDIWRVLGTYGDGLDLSDFGTFVSRKCAKRGVDFSDAAAFFQGATLEHVEKTWEQWLGALVPDLPPFEKVIAELRPMVSALFAETP